MTDLFGELRRIGEALGKIAAFFSAGGELFGNTDGLLVSPAGNAGNTVYVQSAGENRRRTKWSIQNVDAANDLEWSYRPDIAWGKGFRISKNGGAYTDDSIRCYKGPIYVRCDPTLAAATTVAFRIGEEWR